MIEKIVAGFFVLTALLVLMFVILAAISLIVDFERVHLVKTTKNYFRKKRCEKFPSCRNCRWLDTDSWNSRYCLCPQGMEMYERRMGSLVDHLDAVNNRGSRYCNFEARDDNE